MEFLLKLSNNLDAKNLVKLNIKPADLENSNSYEAIINAIQTNYGLNSSEFVLLSKNGVEIRPGASVHDSQIFQICPKVLGGKGGFGSLLRAFGKQITMSTNKEACRDLTGRRIRHVNNEKKLKDFLEKQNELAKQKEETKREKAERRKKKRDKLEAKHHLFVDANYDKQKEKISQDLDEAITKAIEQKKITKQIDSDKSTEAQVETETQEELKVPEEVAKPSTSFTKLVEPLKKKSNDTVSNNKMFSDWMGCNDLEVSSSSSEDELTLPAKKMKV